ncbi:OmpA family protein [Oceanicella actignis]|uniref:Outer membrane protein OmpA n=1 Tax=Oceanicella actignis TaxID=1189325 RepID=A0A1M7TKD2_9RHOB|nr:OmpA family protein [Oceanicella actignis]SET67684.1 Outer membrane protein OmpA [Oceanicella actignis]SHN71088.1 Outer membrane protein OmpA [Oceanicella actignis]
MTRIVIAAALGAATLLSACADRPAGSAATGASFGAATASNVIGQAAYAYADRRLVAMSDKFRAEAPDTVTFDFDKAVLDADARRALDAQAAWLKAHPKVRMRIYGHADKVGSEAYNDRLGLRRARAVVRYLVSKGVERNRLDAVESRGEREPVVPTEERERRNRRAVTEVAGFERGYVGDPMDGKRALLGYKEYTFDRIEFAKATSTAGGG